MGGGMVTDDVLARLHPLEVKVLPHLKDNISLSDLAKAANLQEVEAMRACQWLENKGALTLEPLTTRQITLDANALKALKQGMPEQRFLDALRNGATTRDAIIAQGKLDPQEFGASLGLLKRERLIEMEGDAFTLTKRGEKANFTPTTLVLRKVQEMKTLSKTDEQVLDALKERKAYLTIKERKDRNVKVTDLGKQLAKVDIRKLDFHERLTAEDLATGAWKDKRYRAYDVTINVPQLPGGKIHFVQEALDYIRRIWIEMGFQEMEGTMTQSAFWDLDALFVPQDHPAREMQDTFYLGNPERTNIDRKAFERVRDVHEHGAHTGSVGWRYQFSKEESERMMLRTHTTALSAQTLWRIKQGEFQVPGKYFTIGKVFRNEKLDWKHLFEFHQVEGIVVDKNVTLAHLLGYLKIFFAKMGFPDVRMRPSHFPYTEPSCEVDVWSPHKKEWVELGGSGIFRPEVTKTLTGEEIPVLAWGLGLERIIVAYFGLNDLRDLYRNDIKQLREMQRFLRAN